MLGQESANYIEFGNVSQLPTVSLKFLAEKIRDYSPVGDAIKAEIEIENYSKFE